MRVGQNPAKQVKSGFQTKENYGSSVELHSFLERILC